MINPMKEIQIPERVPEDAEEFARLIRHPDGRTILLIDAWAYLDPFLWGMHVVDLLHHAALALDETCDLHTTDGRKVTREEILQCMRDGFTAEWLNRTDEAKPFSDA